MRTLQIIRGFGWLILLSGVVLSLVVPSLLLLLYTITGIVAICAASIYERGWLIHGDSK